eukprot:TRINITY_DN63215_c0_g1_i1.p2 TRINITY_DN63215_c0_g1~~TRINITY_DN63215_c0_g1_i1.p2  ORF type:complete len:121 (+),score=10.79 TRINITY_DN63215_c0_g1_i1:48-410(+)
MASWTTTEGPWKARQPKPTGTLGCPGGHVSWSVERCRKDSYVPPAKASGRQVVADTSWKTADEKTMRSGLHAVTQHVVLVSPVVYDVAMMSGWVKMRGEKAPAAKKIHGRMMNVDGREGR